MTSSQQTIYRAEHHSNYTVAANEILEDNRLKAESRFLLVYLIGKPSNWKINVEHLAKVLNKGMNFVRDCINELIAHGYAKRELVRKERGRFGEHITKIFERPNLDRETIVTTSRFTTNGRTTSDETVHIQSKEEINSGSNQVNIQTPPTSSEIQEEEVKIHSFLGIKSNSQLLATFGAMLRPLFNGITDLVDQLSAPPPMPKPKVNPPDRSVDNQAPIASASVLRKLSEITGESVESLRTNLGLQKTLEQYPERVEQVIQYLELDCKGIKPGVGLVVVALQEGRKATKAGGATWKEWADRAIAQKLLSYSTSEGNDILIVFKNDKCLLWSKAQKMSWDEVRVIAGETAF